MSNIQLHVGYIGITREGKRVEITKSDDCRVNYHWVGSNGQSYTKQGYYYCNQKQTKDDIVGPWVETPVEPQVNYNDGKWHRWDGATECPVHEDSIVEVNCISFDQLLITDSTYARYYNWDSDLASIVAFRVTKEYVAPVEPREFWIELNSNTSVCATHLKKTKFYSGTTLVHVKEVTNA